MSTVEEGVVTDLFLNASWRLWYSTMGDTS